MPCSYPITIRDNKRGTDINPVFRLVPCGYCISCVQRKRADWSFRLHQEAKTQFSKLFSHLPMMKNTNRKRVHSIKRNYRSILNVFGIPVKSSNITPWANMARRERDRIIMLLFLMFLIMYSCRSGQSLTIQRYSKVSYQRTK